ncbi:MAG: hypothetical protein M3Q97_07520, partial [Bacteroidota bacterium]|nr:hypothetical protein [Bacteroidota bacterium]
VKQQQHQGIYRLPAAIDIYTREGIRREQVIIDGQEETFVFDMNEAPLLVNFDADKYLLAQKTETKPIGQWEYQFAHAPLLADRYEALKALGSKSRQLPADSLAHFFIKALADSSEFIRLTAVNILREGENPGNYSALTNAMINVSVKDPNSHVRASAIAWLYINGTDKGYEIFESALSDSSYHVLSMALNVLMNDKRFTSDTQSLIQKLKEHEDARGSNVVLTLSRIYSKYGDSTNGDYFHRAPRYLGHHEIFYFLIYYETFLKRQSAEFIYNERFFIKTLEEHTPQDGNQWAYQNLLLQLGNHLERSKKTEPGALTEDQWNELFTLLRPEKTTPAATD